MQAQSEVEVTLYIKREDADTWLFRGRYYGHEAAELACIRIIKFDERFAGKPKVVEWRILPMWG